MALTLASSASVSLSYISHPPPSSSLLPPSSSFVSVSSNGYRVQGKNLSLQSELIGGTQKWSHLSPWARFSMIVKASSEGRSTEGDGGESPSEAPKEPVSVENLPLESKLQMKLEAKLRMKLAKKIRLRRKRLVRKRRLRKKGRWPPSKMRKLKNV